MKITSSDQRDTVRGVDLVTQSIIQKQTHLAQSMSTQHIEIGGHLRSQAQDQSRAFASQKFATTQISVDLQNIKIQVEAILALQQSLAGFVSFIPLISKVKSDESDNQQGFNALPGANASDLA